MGLREPGIRREPNSRLDLPRVEYRFLWCRTCRLAPLVAADVAAAKAPAVVAGVAGPDLALDKLVDGLDAAHGTGLEGVDVGDVGGSSDGEGGEGAEDDGRELHDELWWVVAVAAVSLPLPSHFRASTHE